jgi:predicted transcriptional regulator
MTIKNKGLKVHESHTYYLVATSDLAKFKEELLAEIRDLLKANNQTASKKWLKSNEVRKLLSISAGSLQTLRVNGTLPYTKIGGAFYYSFDNIQKMLEKNKT